MSEDSNMMFLYIGTTTKTEEVDALLSWTNPKPPANVNVPPVQPPSKSGIFNTAINFLLLGLAGVVMIF